MLTSLWNHGLQPVQWGAVVAVSLVAAIIDVRSHRIPNKLTGPLLLVGLAWASFVGGWGGLLDGLCGVAVVGLPFFLLWILRAGGAGDAKMMMAIGAWLGVINGTVALLAVALAGGIVSIGYALYRRHLRSAVANVIAVGVGVLLVPVSGQQSWKDRRELIPSIKSAQAFPYGVAIFLGTSLAAVAVLVYRTRF